MKKILFLCLALASITACTTTPPQRGISTNNTNNNAQSPEAQARQKTEEMKKTLGLTTEQADKVLITNTVHLKILKRLNDNNETDKIPATEESYKAQMKEILTPDQYATFLNLMNQ